MRNTNSTTTLKTGHGPSRSLKLVRCEDMAAADRLPQGLRHMLWETPVKLSAVTVLAYLHSIERQVGDPHRAEIITARKLLELEQSELEAFSEDHRQRHGRPLPHMAAKVPCVRYGKRGEASPYRRRGRRRPQLEGTTI